MNTDKTTTDWPYTRIEAIMLAAVTLLALAWLLTHDGWLSVRVRVHHRPDRLRGLRRGARHTVGGAETRTISHRRRTGRGGVDGEGSKHGHHPRQTRRGPGAQNRRRTGHAGREPAHPVQRLGEGHGRPAGRSDAHELELRGMARSGRTHRRRPTGSPRRTARSDGPRDTSSTTSLPACSAPPCRSRKQTVAGTADDTRPRRLPRRVMREP